MGKATFKGFVPPDDPMFSGGPELFSIRPLGAFSATPTARAGEPQDVSKPPSNGTVSGQNRIKAGVSAGLPPGH